jgi:transcription factor MYB, plant
VQQHRYYSGGRDRPAFVATTMTPPPAQQHSQQCASSAASGGDACSFGAAAMYSSPSAMQAPALVRYGDGSVPAPQQLAEFSPAAPPPALPSGVANSWADTTGGMAALEDMFLADLLAAGEFPRGDHLFGGGFGSLLHQDRASSLSLPELSACYFPNTQAEMWADARPPAGLCHSLT